jgi:hypothetical protein
MMALVEQAVVVEEQTGFKMARLTQAVVAGEIVTLAVTVALVLLF